MERPRESYCCAIDAEGRVMLVWWRSPSQSETPQAPAAADQTVHQLAPPDGDAMLASIQQGIGYWRDAAGTFIQQAPWIPAGLPPVTEIVAGEEIRVLTLPTDVVLTWSDPAGLVKLRVNGLDYDAASPFTIALTLSGRYVVEVVDARYRSRQWIVELRLPL